MGAKIDLIGQRFERLLVLEDGGRDPSGEMLWTCICDCGSVTTTRGCSLTKGYTQSCGCLQKERSRKHGHCLSEKERSPTYISWTAMRARCNNPKAAKYPLYGGRGITIDPAWDSFENFLRDMGERPQGKTLDRKDSDKGYYKDNCRWATSLEQRHNRRDSK